MLRLAATTRGGQAARDKEESMARTPIVTRDRVPEFLRAAFDAETARSGGVVATGPGSVVSAEAVIQAFAGR